MRDIPLEDLCVALCAGLTFFQEQGLYDLGKFTLKEIAPLQGSALLARFVPSSTDSLDIRVEAGTIMGAMASFFKEEFRLPRQIKQFAVQAVSEEGQEIMYVVCSPATAALVSQGKASEWFAKSVFHDNTPEQIVARLKLRIRRIEKGLRTIIADSLRKHQGPTWWVVSINHTIRHKAEGRAQKELPGKPLPEELLEYTDLPDLKTILLANWACFTSVFSDPISFGDSMDDLNVLRRKIAHNRDPTPTDEEDLDRLYHYLMGSIATAIPDVVPNYLVENWHTQLRQVIDDTAEELCEIPNEEKRFPALVVVKFRNNNAVLERAAQRLKSIEPPPSKQKLHEELTDIWEQVLASSLAMEDAASSGNIPALEVAAKNNAEAHNRLHEFKTRFLLSER